MSTATEVPAEPFSPSTPQHCDTAHHDNDDDTNSTTTRSRTNSNVNNNNMESSMNDNSNSTTTTRRPSLMNASSSPSLRSRGMSRVDIAATYAREPARIRSLTIAQARAKGESPSTSTSSTKRADPMAASTNTAATSIFADEELSWYQTIHKLHLICAVFSFLGFILGLVSFLTNFWYKSRSGTENRNSGLFYECIDGNCATTDWRTIFWTVSCSVSGDRIKWNYYVNRGFIFTSIVACVIAFFLIMISKVFYLESMRAQSFAVMTFMIIPVVCWCVAIGRYGNWQNKEFYCGKTFCDVKFEDAGITDCEESFGYSFILGVLCLILHVFGAVFAIARHVFGEWALEDVEGDDLELTTLRVNVEHTKKKMRRASSSNISISAGDDGEQQQQQQYQNNSNENNNNNTNSVSDQLAKTSPSPTVRRKSVMMIADDDDDEGEGQNNSPQSPNSNMSSTTRARRKSLIVPIVRGVGGGGDGKGKPISSRPAPAQIIRPAERSKSEPSAEAS